MQELHLGESFQKESMYGYLMLQIKMISQQLSKL